MYMYRERERERSGFRCHSWRTGVLTYQVSLEHAHIGTEACADHVITGYLAIRPWGHETCMGLSLYLSVSLSLYLSISLSLYLSISLSLYLSISLSLYLSISLSI